MSMLTLYFFTVLGKVGGTLMAFIAFSAISIFALSMFYWLELSSAYGKDEDVIKNKSVVKKWNIRFLKAIIFCLMLNLFIPNIKETAFIYIVGKVSQNEQLQKVPDKALQILNLKLDEYLKDFDIKDEVKK